MRSQGLMCGPAGVGNVLISSVLLLDRRPVGISVGAVMEGEVDRWAMAVCFGFCIACELRVDTGLIDSHCDESKQLHCNDIVTICSATCKQRPVGFVVVMCNQQFDSFWFFIYSCTTIV